MKIVRGQLMPIGGRSEYTTAWTNLKGENNIVNLINKYPNDIFQFVILAETVNEKAELTPGGTAPTAVFQFGPESYMTSDMISSGRHKKLLEFQQKFGPIKIATVAKDSRGKETFNDSGFIAKFGDDGKITTEFSEIGKTNESLPREQTVKQWQKLRKMTKGIDIGDRVSDMNKQGANIQYIQNPVDTGIESYEDFERKNKSFVPSWNLKGMLSPYRKNKIKRFNEGVWNYQRKADGDLCRQIARDLYYGNDDRVGFYDRQESGEKIKYKELEELFNNPKELHKEATWDMFERVLSELANDENWDEKVGINFYSEDDYEIDEDEIEPGDYVNFNKHGLLYVVSILGDGYLVSEDEEQRYEGDDGDGFIIPFDSEGTIIEKGN